MRSSSRLVAVAALGAATVLAGAATANAQAAGITFSSPSTLDVSFVNDEIYVSYDNRSGHDLECAIMVSTAPVVDAIHGFLLTSEDPSGDFTDPDRWPAPIQSAIAAALEAGEFAIGHLPSVPDGNSGFVPAVPVSEDPIHTGFAIEGVTVCLNGAATYMEIERTTGGAGGSLGSLFGS